MPLDPNILVFGKLLLATVLGLLLGIERTVAHKSAGMRTYALVTLGSALFVSIGELLNALYLQLPAFNPAFIAGNVIVGIGFIGTGLAMMHRDSSVNAGVTTIAGIWVSAGVGIAVGLGFYEVAIFTTFLTLFIFTVIWFLEHRYIRHDGDSYRP